MTYKAKIFLISILWTSICAGQTTNVLNLKKRKYYSEQNSLLLDSLTTLMQEVCYNEPQTIDEEYCLILTITICDTIKAKQLKTIDLTKDTSVIKCVWELNSVWNWAVETTTISGSINVIAWTKKSLEISFNINVFNKRNVRTYVYNGKRTFLNKRKS